MGYHIWNIMEHYFIILLLEIEAVLLDGRYAGIGPALTCHQLLNVLYGMKWTPLHQEYNPHNLLLTSPGQATDTV